MSNINLTAGFTMIPEGTHVFHIEDVNYKDAFGKMEIKMKTKKGYTHIEHFSLLDKNQKPNEPALNAFSYFAKIALNDFSRLSIDHEELIGKYIKAKVVHETYTNKDGEEKKTARLKEKFSASGFEEDDVPSDTPSEEPKKKVDLSSILG